ncbi:hypothetical protein B0A49_04404 [Cryomyces minteri]|uniref:XPG-I domain-containing protein n=1 Tax=Cryomyces minteri TaxID=331657 RepID=A0A4U0X5P4_9PEZI|nr:hypothetical protein B0A49_04404 [Cryomyces minteri]
MNRVRMLIHFGVKPYLVFDGDHLPSKAGTERGRKDRRKESKRAGLELLRLGKVPQAHLELQKGVDVTPEMARQLIEELKRAGVDYVVAPYEADSQLAYLERKGIINGVLSEDSDLLVFGAKCLLTKLDQYGDCIVIRRDDFTACREISLVGWSDADFRRMAILSGCDYLPSISKMGLKTAYRLLRKHKTVERVVRFVQFDGGFKVPPGYLEAFNQAEMTFLYPWVFCPVARCLVTLTELEPDIDLDSMPYIGQCVEPNISAAVASGDLHPHSKQPIVIHTKPRHSSSSRKVSRAETPDLKKHKPIDSFFGPKRTPLAELDPNSFTPSPSQQRLLHEEHRPWSADPAPSRPYLNRARTTIPTAAPSPSTKKGANGKKVARMKMNIWSDDSIEEARAELQDVTGPSAEKRERKELTFPADDRVASTDIASQTTSQSTISTFAAISQQSQSHLLNPTTTPTTSFGSAAPDLDSQGSVFSTSLSQDITVLRAKFSYQSTAHMGRRTDPDDRMTGPVEPEPLKRTCSTPLPRQTPLQKSERQRLLGRLDLSNTARGSSQLLEIEAQTGCSFSLAQLEVPAHNATDEAETTCVPSSSSLLTWATPCLPTTPDEVLSTAEQEAVTAFESEQDIGDAAWLVLESEFATSLPSQHAAVKASDDDVEDEEERADRTLTPEPVLVESFSRYRYSDVKGSEDLLLIPDSESEAESLADEDIDVVRKKLDLGRFEFVGR